MLKKITLAAFVILGTAGFVGASAGPAAAENMRSVRHLDGGAVKHGVYHQRRGWRSTGYRHYRPRVFHKRVRSGGIVCYRTIRRAQLRRAHLRRQVRLGHGYYHTHGRRLGRRAVRRLVRSGRRHAMSCFARY